MHTRPVLVIERDDLLRETLLESLYDAGFEVHGAYSADDGLGVLGSHERRWLILLDAGRPAAAGLGFLEALRVFQVPEGTFEVFAMVDDLDTERRLKEMSEVRHVFFRPLQFPAMVRALQRAASQDA